MKYQRLVLFRGHIPETGFLLNVRIAQSIQQQIFLSG
eukprot:XP_001708642.1 Hypothetical protein GL50803_105665 [Giardia lamblia ATCC 50803]